MFDYKQFMHMVDFAYVNGSFDYAISTENGMRREIENSNLIESIKSENSNFELQIMFSSSDCNRLRLFFKKIYIDLQKSNIDFSAFVKLYNEKIVINNEKEDIRSYGFCKIVLKDCLGNVYIDEIPITNSLIDVLEIDILKNIRSNVENIKKYNKKLSRLEFDSVSVVFSQMAAGYFIHEILGHSLESDFFSYYKNNFDGLKISSKLTVIDSIKGFENIIGLNKYDDVGEVIKPLIVVNKGSLCNIFSIKKEDSLDGILYGFARREFYKFDVMPRMRCTFIKPFDDINEEKIIYKYNTAIYFNKAYMGGVNPQNGDYNVIGNGFLLRNGEKCEFIENLKLHGNLLNDLNSFEYIGNDLKIFGNFCSKLGQTVRVAVGSPTISLGGLSVEGNLYGRVC